jgi:hypothetical protein
MSGSQHTDQALGGAIGAALGFVNSLITDAALGWDSVLNTAVLSAVGATIGFAVTTALKWIKKKAQS